MGGRYEQTANVDSAIEFCPNCGTPLGMTDAATQPKIDFCMPLGDMLDALDAHVEMPPVSRRDVVVITPECLAELEAVVDAAQELTNKALIVSGPLDGYYHRAHQPCHWWALEDALNALKKKE